MKIAVIVARFDGETPRRVPVQVVPEEYEVKYFYLSDKNMKFSKQLTAEQKEHYVKFQPHKIPSIKECDVFIWIDKNVKVISEKFISTIGEGDENFEAYPYLLVEHNTEVTQKALDEQFKRPVKKAKSGERKYQLSFKGLDYVILPSQRPLIGFWHIALFNNWQKIVEEQMSELLSSGLYDAAQQIRIGIVGHIEELKKLSAMLSKYKKIKTGHYHENITEYEFPTLNLIKQEAKVNEFFGFYIHTKGVTFNGHSGGTHWRHYMNYYVIERWRDCHARLKDGNNLCGVKLLRKSIKYLNPTHYSGNFFHFRSEFIETLPEIDTLNRNDRFQAEFWIGLGKEDMKAVSLCDKFIDYNVQGDFVKPVTGRMVVHTLAFNLPSETKTAVELLYSQNPDVNFEHVIADLGFPLEEGDIVPADIEKAKQNNSKLLSQLAKKHGSDYCKLPNIGVSQNWEQVRKHTKIGNNDVLICQDPDERPKNDNWVRAVSDVLMHGNKIAWCSLFYTDHIPVIKNYPHEITYVYGHKIFLMHSLIGWAQGGFNGKFLNEIGGVPAHEKAPVYGWIEEVCYAKMKKLGWKWAILADYYVSHTECSPLYREWKTLITSKVHEGQMSFETFLKAKSEQPQS